MDPLITICARAGSKGLPGKNHKLLHGKPLCQWTLDQAVEWGKGLIVVSTDSYEISEGVKEYPDVVLIKRPEDLSGDDVSKLDVIRHALFYVEAQMRKEYEAIIDLDVTNPMRTVEDIENIYKIWREYNPDSVISVTSARRSPYFNQLEGGKTFNVSKPFNSSVIRRQDCPSVWDINCCLYVYSREFIQNKRNVHPVGMSTMIYPMPDYTFMDTDDIMSFKIMSFLMREYGPLC